MNLKAIALSGVFTVVALSVGAAHAATDNKSFHASGGCKVYGATPWTSLGFGWQGVFNTTSSPVQIICPIVTDAEVAWEPGVTNAYVHMHVRSGTVPGSVTCSIYSNVADGLTSADTIGISMAANVPNEFGDSGNLTKDYPADGGVMMMCQLGAKTALVHYALTEYAATDVP